MKSAVLVIGLVVSTATLLAVAGCAGGRGCPNGQCGVSNSASIPYAPSSYPAYASPQGQSASESGGSTTRPAPVVQGSDSR